MDWARFAESPGLYVLSKPELVSVRTVIFSFHSAPERIQEAKA